MTLNKEIRIYIAEVLIYVVLKILPKGTQEGNMLAVMCKAYLINSGKHLNNKR